MARGKWRKGAMTGRPQDLEALRHQQQALRLANSAMVDAKNKAVGEAMRFAADLAACRVTFEGAKSKEEAEAMASLWTKNKGKVFPEFWTLSQGLLSNSKTSKVEGGTIKMRVDAQQYQATISLKREEEEKKELPPRPPLETLIFLPGLLVTKQGDRNAGTFTEVVGVMVYSEEALGRGEIDLVKDGTFFPIMPDVYALHNFEGGPPVWGKDPYSVFMEYLPFFKSEEMQVYLFRNGFPLEHSYGDYQTIQDSDEFPVNEVVETSALAHFNLEWNSYLYHRCEDYRTWPDPMVTYIWHLQVEDGTGYWIDVPREPANNLLSVFEIYEGDSGNYIELADVAWKIHWEREQVYKDEVSTYITGAYDCWTYSFQNFFEDNGAFYQTNVSLTEDSRGNPYDELPQLATQGAELLAAQYAETEFAHWTEFDGTTNSRADKFLFGNYMSWKDNRGHGEKMPNHGRGDYTAWHQNLSEKSLEDAAELINNSVAVKPTEEFNATTAYYFASDFILSAILGDDSEEYTEVWGDEYIWWANIVVEAPGKYSAFLALEKQTIDETHKTTYPTIPFQYVQGGPYEGRSFNSWNRIGYQFHCDHWLTGHTYSLGGGHVTVNDGHNPPENHWPYDIVGASYQDRWYVPDKNNPTHENTLIQRGQGFLDVCIDGVWYKDVVVTEEWTYLQDPDPYLTWGYGALYRRLDRSFGVISFEVIRGFANTQWYPYVWHYGFFGNEAPVSAKVKNVPIKYYNITESFQVATAIGDIQAVINFGCSCMVGIELLARKGSET